MIIGGIAAFMGGFLSIGSLIASFFARLGGSHKHKFGHCRATVGVARV